VIILLISIQAFAFKCSLDRYTEKAEKAAERQQRDQDAAGGGARRRKSLDRERNSSGGAGAGAGAGEDAEEALRWGGCTSCECS
jgi:hypothetical protein